MPIQWNYMEAPSGAASLDAMARGNDSIVKGIATLGSVANAVKADKIKENTNVLANILSQARNPVELESALIQMNQAAQGMGGQYDQAAIRELGYTLPPKVAELQSLKQANADSSALLDISTAIANQDYITAQGNVARLTNPSIANTTANSIAALANTVQDNDQAKVNAANTLAVQLAQIEAKNNGNGSGSGSGSGGGKTVTINDVEWNPDGSLKVGQKPSQDQTAINYYGVKNGKMATTPTTMQVANWGNTEQDAYNYFTDRIKGKNSPEGFTKNKESTANGVGQLLDSTFYNTVARHRPELLVGRTYEQVSALKNDPTIATEMFEKHTQDNMVDLKRAGIPVTPTTLDGTHWFGINKFTELWNTAQKNPNTPISSLIDKETLRVNYLTDDRRNKQKKPPVKTVGDLFEVINQRQGLGNKSAIDRNIPAEFIEGMRGSFALDRQIIQSNFTAQEIASKAPDFKAQQEIAAFLEADSSYGLPFSSGNKAILSLAQGVPGFNDLPDSSKASVLKQLETYNKQNQGSFTGIDVGETALKKVALDTITKLRGGKVAKLDGQITAKLLEYKIKLASGTRNYGVTKWDNKDVVDLLMPEASSKEKERYVSLMEGVNNNGKGVSTTDNPFGTNPSIVSQLMLGADNLSKKVTEDIAKKPAKKAEPKPTPKPSVPDSIARNALVGMGVPSAQSILNATPLPPSRPITMPVPTATIDPRAVAEQQAINEITKRLGIKGIK